MSTKVTIGKPGGQSGIFNCNARQLDSQQTPILSAEHTLILSVPVSLMIGDDTAFASITTLTALGRAFISMVHFLSKAHQATNQDTVTGAYSPDHKATYVEMCPKHDSIVQNVLYFGEARSSVNHHATTSNNAGSQSTQASSNEEASSSHAGEVGGVAEDSLMNQRDEPGEIEHEEGNEASRSEIFAGGQSDSEDDDQPHLDDHMQFGMDLNLTGDDSVAYERNEDDAQGVYSGNEQGTHANAAAHAHAHVNNASFLANCHVIPHPCVVRIYWNGTYDVEDAILECLSVNRAAYYALSTGSEGGKPARRRPPNATELLEVLKKHPDKSLTINTKEAFIRTLCVLKGVGLDDVGMASALRQPLSAPTNPMCLHRTLGLATAVNPRASSVHVNFRTPTHYVEQGTLKAPKQLRFPHPEMVYMFQSNEEQAASHWMNTILPVPVPVHLVRATLEETQYVDTFDKTSADNADGITCAEPTPAELHYTSASSAFRMAGGGGISLATGQSMNALSDASKAEMLAFDISRREAKRDRPQGVTDKALRDSAWDSFVGIQSRMFSNGTALLDPNNASHSTASEATVKMLASYLADNNGVLFRMQSRAFKNLSRVQSWLAMRAISLEYVYKMATAHQMTLRMMFGALNAPDMDPNKIHVMNIGAGDTSKSFSLDTVLGWAVPGQAEDVAHKTAMADTVPINKDMGIEAWHEANPEWYGIGANGKTSTNPAESRFKNRLTSGVMNVEACSLDEQGNRVSIMYKRPCNVSVLVNLNLNKGQISQPMLSRFLYTESNSAPRPGKSIAHCICETPSNGERITKQTDRENMQWLMMLVTLTHTFIRAGLLPRVETPVADMYVPRVLSNASLYGLSKLDAPRHLLRLLAAVRALVVVRAVLFVFGSPLSPLAIRNEATGCYTGQKFTMHSFALVAFHLTDSWDPTIFSSALGMVAHQWEPPARYQVIEAIMLVLFPCSEEAFDATQNTAVNATLAVQNEGNGTEVSKTDHELVQAAVDEADETGIVTTRRGRAHQVVHDWTTIVRSQEETWVKQATSTHAAGNCFRLAMTGDADGLSAWGGVIAKVRAASSVSGRPERPTGVGAEEEGGAYVDVDADADADVDLDTGEHPAHNRPKRKRDAEGGNGKEERGTSDVPDAPDTPDTLGTSGAPEDSSGASANKRRKKQLEPPTVGDDNTDAFAYAGTRSLLPGNEICVPPQRTRVGMHGHGTRCCVCCICVTCFDRRVATQGTGACVPHIDHQRELLLKKTMGPKDNAREGSSSKSAHGAPQGRYSSSDPRRNNPNNGAANAAPAAGRPSNAFAAAVAATHATSSSSSSSANAAPSRGDAHAGLQARVPHTSRSAFQQLVDSPLSMDEAAEIGYAARAGSTHIFWDNISAAIKHVEPDRALYNSELDILASDSKVIRRSKNNRKEVAVSDTQKRMRRAYHLEQARFEVMDPQYFGAYVQQKLFDKVAHQETYQCVAELAKQLKHKLRGFTTASITATLRELMETRVPVTMGGCVLHLPVLRINVDTQRLFISKSLLINNRRSVLQHLTQDILEHRLTVPMTHLFGPDNGPAAVPYLFSTFTPAPSRKEPDQKSTDKKCDLAILALEHNVAHSEMSRGLVRALAVEGKHRVLTQPPEWEAAGDFLNTMAVPNDVARRYNIRPEVELMRMETELLAKDQALWQTRFQAQVKHNVDFNKHTPTDAFHEARKKTGERPPDMLCYPPIASNKANAKVVLGTRTDYEWCVKWGWAELATQIDTHKKTTEALCGDNGKAADSLVDYVEYDMGDARFHTNFVGDIQQEPYCVF
jgi:hypothetical protein